MLRRFAWGSCGGAITGLQNFLKDFLILFRVSDSISWCAAFFAFMAGASAFGGLLMLTGCMKRYDATYSAASFVGSFVVSASIMSAVHYNTFSDLTGVWNYILYPSGLVVLMTGVLILVRESLEHSQENEEDEPVSPVRKNSDDSKVRHEMDFFSLILSEYPYAPPFNHPTTGTIHVFQSRRRRRTRIFRLTILQGHTFSAYEIDALFRWRGGSFLDYLCNSAFVAGRLNAAMLAESASMIISTAPTRSPAHRRPVNSTLGTFQLFLFCLEDTTFQIILRGILGRGNQSVPLMTDRRVGAPSIDFTVNFLSSE
jgi:hypothetical protein